MRIIAALFMNNLNSKFVKEHNLPTQASKKSQQVKLATGIKTQVKEKVRKINIQIGSYHDRQRFMVLPLEDNDVILGSLSLEQS